MDSLQRKVMMRGAIQAIIGAVLFFLICGSASAREETMSLRSLVDSSAVIGIARLAKRPESTDQSCQLIFSRGLKGRVSLHTPVSVKANSPTVSVNRDLLVFVNLLGKWTCVGEVYSARNQGKERLYLLRVPTETGPSSIMPAFLTLSQLEAMIRGKKLVYEFKGALRFGRNKSRRARTSSPIMLQVLYHSESLDTIVKGLPQSHGFASKPTLNLFGTLFRSPLIRIALTTTDTRPLVFLGEVVAAQGSSFQVDFYVLAPTCLDVNQLRKYLADATLGKPHYRLTFFPEANHRPGRVHKLSIEMTNQSLHDLGQLHGWQPRPLPLHRVSYECKLSRENREKPICSLTMSVNLSATKSLQFILLTDELADRAVSLGSLFPLDYDWVAACLVNQDVKGRLLLRSGETETVVGTFTARTELVLQITRGETIQGQKRGQGRKRGQEP